MNVVTGRLNDFNEREAWRYLGYTAGANGLSALTKQCGGIFEECKTLVLQVQELRAVYEVFDVRECEGGLDLGFAFTASRDLKKYLAGCKKLVLFAATAGAGIDRAIAKYSRLSPARAAVIQAQGAALAEDWCNFLHDGFITRRGALKARFSPGFGDLSLDIQRDIFRALQVTKNIGVVLSDDCFMTPSKSVTAIAGIKD